MIARASCGVAVAVATALIWAGGAAASTTPVKHPTVKNHRGWKMTCKRVKKKKHGQTIRVEKCTFKHGKTTIETTPGNGVSVPGQKGPEGPQGPQGPGGQNGRDGANGANPATPVIHVRSIAASSGRNPNPDSGDAGDAGFYYTGDGSGGSASIEGGQLVLQGNGVDPNTWQGGVGIAKAYNNLPLGDLSALSYDWHVDTVNGDQAPSIHITVMGATNDSHFSSGFTNLVYSPFVSAGITPQTGVQYAADAFLGNWYSTDEPGVNSVSNPGSQDDPQPLSYFVGHDPNAVIIQISLDNGGTSGGTGTFLAGADDLVIGTTPGAFDRYDFGG
jgi:hypothetical protein